MLKTTRKTLTEHSVHTVTLPTDRERESIAYLFLEDALDATHYSNLFPLWCTLKKKNVGKQNWQTIPFVTLRAY